MNTLVIFFLFFKSAVAQDIQAYCTATIQETMSIEKKEAVCLCLQENFKILFSAKEKIWILSKNKKGMRSNTWHSPMREKILLQHEFEVLKNCSQNYKYRAASDDLGIPESTEAP